MPSGADEQAHHAERAVGGDGEALRSIVSIYTFLCKMGVSRSVILLLFRFTSDRMPPRAAGYPATRDACRFGQEEA